MWKLLWCWKCAPCNNLFEHSPQTACLPPKQDGWHLQCTLDLIVCKYKWKLMHIERCWRLLLPRDSACCVYLQLPSRADESSVSPDNKEAAVWKAIGGVIRDRLVVASFSENRKGTFFPALNTVGARLNHIVVLIVTARADIDEITVEPVCTARLGRWWTESN